MRILFLTHAFNSLTQRLWLELSSDGHEISIEYDINDSMTRDAVRRWQPGLIVAPFLKRAIPADVWQSVPCLIVHPGPPGDRGPSALDWAIQEGQSEWGVTVLQAVEEMDAGPVWAFRNFAMRDAPKSSLYRREVTEAAIAAVREAIDRIAGKKGPLHACNTAGGNPKPQMRQRDREIDWAMMTMDEIITRVHAADGQPGVADDFLGHRIWLHDGHAAPGFERHPPGKLIGRSGEAILRACADGAVWIGHLKIELADGSGRLKLPATAAMEALGIQLPPVMDHASAPNVVETETIDDIAVIRFPFLNGAMSTERSRQLEAAIRTAADGPAKAVLLTGGPEFWSNGIDLATIEVADSPAEASWEAINAIDDVCLAMLEARDASVISLMRGNAGAGGVFLALAADRVMAREGVVLSPHYKNMGNLFGSEYWTYLLPRRLGEKGAKELMSTRMPLSAANACEIGMIDCLVPGNPATCEEAAITLIRQEIANGELEKRIALKREGHDKCLEDLAACRENELQHMKLNFFGFDTSYHVARHNFITAVPKSRTPLHLARHRLEGARLQAAQ